jgi:hypothetical protein
MECPFCGCQTFYINHPDDEYETFEFDVKDGKFVFSEEIDQSEHPVIEEETETNCNRCAWHGKIRELKKEGQ